MTNNGNEQKLLSCEEIDAFRRLRESLVAVGFQVDTASPSALCDVIEGLMFDDVEKLKAAATKHAEAFVVALKTAIGEATDKALKAQTDSMFDVQLFGQRTGKTRMNTLSVNGVIQTAQSVNSQVPKVKRIDSDIKQLNYPDFAKTYFPDLCTSAEIQHDEINTTDEGTPDDTTSDQSDT